MPLKDNDFKTFEQLCGLTQRSLKKAMFTYLKTKYNTVIQTEDYILAEGDIPIALCAHLDTVFTRPAVEIFYDRTKNVIWSPQGLGADDRAGVFAILQIIKKGLRPHIIFTTDEERGGKGAFSLVENENPFKDLRYIIQLDRRGERDCVFYDCDNPEFVEYVESFGFVEAIGSFTDISIICPEWKVAGVNLSIGYRDEHSLEEVLFVDHLMGTISKVVSMLQVKNAPSFKFIPRKNSCVSWYRILNAYDNEHCCKCRKKFDRTEMIPVKTSDFKFKYYCPDCLSDKVDWCTCCGEAFEIPSDRVKVSMCEDCYYDFYYSSTQV